MYTMYRPPLGSSWVLPRRRTAQARRGSYYLVWQVVWRRLSRSIINTLSAFPQWHPADIRRRQRMAGPLWKDGSRARSPPLDKSQGRHDRGSSGLSGLSGLSGCKAGDCRAGLLRRIRGAEFCLVLYL